MYILLFIWLISDGDSSSLACPLQAKAWHIKVLKNKPENNFEVLPHKYLQKGHGTSMESGYFREKWPLMKLARYSYLNEPRSLKGSGK